MHSLYPAYQYHTISSSVVTSERHESDLPFYHLHHLFTPQLTTSSFTIPLRNNPIYLLSPSTLSTHPITIFISSAVVTPERGTTRLHPPSLQPAIPFLPIPFSPSICFGVRTLACWYCRLGVRCKGGEECWGGEVTQRGVGRGLPTGVQMDLWWGVYEVEWRCGWGVDAWVWRVRVWRKVEACDGLFLAWRLNTYEGREN